MHAVRLAMTKRIARGQDSRRGSILVLSAVVLTVIFAMTAFAVDIGYLGLTKTQLQSISDSCALGAALELSPGLGKGSTLTPSQVVTVGSNSALGLAQIQRNGDRLSTCLKTDRDLRFGQLSWDSAQQRWVKSYGVAPYNLVEVTLRRDQTAASSVTAGDHRVPLMFSNIFGVSNAPLVETSAAGLLPGVGFQITAGSSGTVGILPIALDVPSWDALMNGTGPDDYRFDTATGAITSGSDGIREVDLYPYANNALPPGNRGTVDLGSPNNSTNDLKRQILYGLNAYDLSFFGGMITTDNGPIELNGDTGISAGIKDPLDQIKGQPRLIPLFSSVSGPGNNATYVVPKFVPIRIMNVKLTGNPKRVVVQPAPFTSSAVVGGHVSVQTDSYFTSPKLVQ